LQYYRFTILGAGLAGLTLSAELSIRSIPHVVIDINPIGSGASGTPAGLLNPAAAQKAKFQSSAPVCLLAFDRLFEIVSNSEDCSSVILSSHVLRPALDDKLEINFKDSIENGDWPENWVEWLNTNQVAEYGAIQSQGGMFIKKGLAIDFRAWTKALSKFSASKYADIMENAVYEIAPVKNWFVIATSKIKVKTDVIIDCTGSSNRFKSHLKWHSVKGQTRIVKPSEHTNLKTAVSGYGYVVKRENELILGSTYEHNYTEVEPTTDKDAYLLKKASMVTNEVISSNQITERWAGVRVSTPDRLPGIGSLPDNPNFHFIMGLGSKGLYYSAWVASMLADHLLDGKAIPRKYHVSRLQQVENKKG